MEQNADDNGLIASLRLIARKERGITVRVFVTIGATCLMSSAALIAAYVLAILNRQYDPRFGGYYLRVRDSDLAIGFGGAAAIWVGLLSWIWRGPSGKTGIAGSIIGTFVIAGSAFAVSIGIDEWLRREEEYLIAAVLLIAAAIITFIWMRYTATILRGNPVFGRDRQINVECPKCGYSLVGLSTLRCPECGADYTIDELIRAQSYGRGSSDSLADRGGPVCEAPAEPSQTAESS
ncbi:MAG: hypothetical protein H6818_18160 [Phycisphaerales bacterium]|nr:hypothetical protein [Phycisphaerales bacterium]MCB9864832.1 hypothetical protein [Phycisphaerales bacterium]